MESYVCPVCSLHSTDFRFFSNCGHTFCKECILKIIEKKMQFDSEDEEESEFDKHRKPLYKSQRIYVKCPVCQESVKTNTSEITLNFDKVFVKNYALRSDEGLIFLECSDHIGIKKEFFCKDCKLKVCVKCIASKHNQHEILTYSELISQKEKIKQNEKFQVANLVFNLMIQEIETEFDNQIENLKTKKKEIIEKMSNMFPELIEDNNTLNNESVRLFDLDTFLQEFYDFCLSKTIHFKDIELKINSVDFEQWHETDDDDRIINKINEDHLIESLEYINKKDIEIADAFNFSVESVGKSKHMKRVSKKWLFAWYDYVFYDKNYNNISKVFDKKLLQINAINDFSEGSAKITRQMYDLFVRSYKPIIIECINDDQNDKIES